VTTARAVLADQRRRAVHARQVAGDAEGLLDRHDAGRGAMAAPPRLERVAARHGGGYRSRGAGDYDWFYKLSKAEQGRLREGWFSTASTAQSPDEIKDKIGIGEWLNQTRRADMARAVAAGRTPTANRYGGHSVAQLVGHHTDMDADDYQARRPRRTRTGHAVLSRDAGGRPQFFTDENGVVHPIRATMPENQGKAPAYDPVLDEPF
jgi:hypothetical protein